MLLARKQFNLDYNLQKVKLELKDRRIIDLSSPKRYLRSALKVATCNWGKSACAHWSLTVQFNDPSLQVRQLALYKEQSEKINR